MRILLFMFFFFYLGFSFSQNVGDSTINSATSTIKNTIGTDKISDDFHIRKDTAKNKNRFSLPKIKLKETAADVKKSFKRNANGVKSVSKDSLGLKHQETDSTSTKKSIAASGNKLSNPIKSDSLKNKISISQIDSPVKSLQHKKLIPSDSGVRSGYRQQTEKLNLKSKTSSVKNGLANKKDSLLFKSRSGVKTLKPTAVNFLKKQVKGLEPKGTVSLGYEYGVLPFVASDHYPSGGYKAEGSVSFLLLNIPLELMFSYTDVKNVIGLNNYFRLSYDAERYKEQLAKKLDVKKHLEKEQLGKMELKQQQLFQKIEYLNVLKQIVVKAPVTDSLKDGLGSKLNIGINKDSLINLPDTSGLLPGITGMKLPGNIPDTSETGKMNTLKNTIYYKKDSIEDEYKKYKAKYDTLSSEIIKLRGRIDQMENLGNGASSLYSPYLTKTQRILNGIKKFEIGLCHPSYSTFLVNNVPLQGINLEYSENNNFLAITYGTTVNTLLYNTKTIQGTLQGVRNMYNYFDFGNLSSGRKILSLKGGIGAKDDSHIYAGFMLGRGRTDYMIPDADMTSASYTKETNLVLELDAKYKFSETASMDLVLGKSSVKDGNLTTEQIGNALNEIFSNYRSYAFLARLNAEVKKTNTKLTFTARWVDPYFKSFGLGFLRSDNLRYEIKAEQPITKKIKYSIAYRREEDNLLKLYDYKNTLQSINNSLYIKLNHQFNIRLNYIPLFRELRSVSTVIRDKNQIFTGILSYTPKSKTIVSQFNFLYSKYLITADSGNINFENFTYTHQFQFKSGFKTGLNVSWFKNNLKDTLGNDTYLGVLDVGYAAKNGGSYSLGGKMAYKKGMATQYGFVVKVSVKLYKGLFGEVEAEKILIGDYYDNIILGGIKKFPYYCNARLVFNF